MRVARGQSAAAWIARNQAVTGLGAAAGRGVDAGLAPTPRAFWSRWSFFFATLFRSVTSSAESQASGWVFA